MYNLKKKKNWDPFPLRNILQLPQQYTCNELAVGKNN